MPSSKSSSQTSQQVTTTQTTNVNVQNIIEAPKETPLQKLKMLSDVLVSLEGQKTTPQTPVVAAVTVQNPNPLEFLKDPQIWIWLGAGALGLVVIAKKV